MRARRTISSFLPSLLPSLLLSPNPYVGQDESHELHWEEQRVGRRADTVHFLLTTLCRKSICARTLLGESNQNASIRQICLLATSHCMTKATKDN